MCAAGRSEEIAADGIVKGHACSLISAKDVTIPSSCTEELAARSLMMPTTSSPKPSTLLSCRLSRGAEAGKPAMRVVPPPQAQASAQPGSLATTLRLPQTSMTLERRSYAAVVLTRAAEKGRVVVVLPPKLPCESKHMPDSQMFAQAR